MVELKLMHVHSNLHLLPIFPTYKLTLQFFVNIDHILHFWQLIIAVKSTLKLMFTVHHDIFDHLHIIFLQTTHFYKRKI